MKSKWSFTCEISAPTQDPYLLIDFINQSNSLLFDCGVKIWGRIKTLLKLEALFISHAHIDHLIGFDHIIRALLGENKHIDVYGPEGILDRIASKLGGYDWDRAADQELTISVHEICGEIRKTRVFECRKRFVPSPVTQTRIENQIIRQTRDYRISAARVDHGGSPCLAYAFHEFDKLRIEKDAMDQMGLKPGPWVGDLLRTVSAGKDLPALVHIDGAEFPAERLKNDLIRIQRGIKIGYVTDTELTDTTIPVIRDLVDSSDVLVCESTFLDEDREFASRFHHVTAAAAGKLAREARVGKLVLFHVSSRYLPDLYRVAREARMYCENVELSSAFLKNRKSGSRKLKMTAGSE